MNSRKWGITVGLEPIGDVFAITKDLDMQIDGYDPSISPLLETPHEKLVRTMSTRFAVAADSIALWGFTCIRGGRPEMEDVVSVVPSFSKVPIKMFMKDTELDVERTLSQTMHFYGVYDGHGGAQVANYCHDHLHLAMANEIESLKGEFHKGHSGHWEEELDKCFMCCFLKADAKVGMVKRGDAGIDNGESEADECIILASDGLWDVMTKEEVCDAARRMILLWHKKIGIDVSETGGKGADPAAQAAAEHLTKLALQKESKDNISVIVVDLKPYRRRRTKS